MKMSMVTVALSAYNVAPYVAAAIDAVLAQTYRNVELLCIDDASDDGTYEIMQECARRDSRIRVIRMSANRGLAVSRNLALDEARGEWILMVDGDDLMHPQLLEKALDAADRTGAEMVMWDYCEFTELPQTASAAEAPSALASINPTDRAALLRCMAFTWTRLLRVDTMRRLGITYPEGLTKQDIPAHWREVLGIDKIVLLPERLSYYRQRAGATSRRRGSSLFDLPAVLDIVEDDLRRAGRYEQWADELSRRRLNAWEMLYMTIDPQLRPRALDGLLRALDGDCGRYLERHRGEITIRRRIFFNAVKGSVFAMMAYKALRALAELKHRLYK